MSKDYNPQPPKGGRPCSICGRPVTRDDQFVAGRVKGARRTVFVHLACWEAEQKEGIKV